jgi:hypothetical protein
MFLKFLLSKIRSITRFCVECLDKAKYARSFKRAAVNEETLLIAEEGLEDYLQQVKK